MGLDRLGGDTSSDGTASASVKDSDVEIILLDILEQLKIMNFHLSLMTDNAGLELNE